MTESPFSYSREMAVTHKDFFRILPRAMGDHSYTIDGLTVHAAIDEGSVTIKIGAQQVRRIALMAIDYCEVEYKFDDLTQEQVERFKNRFELYYRRGGG